MSSEADTYYALELFARATRGEWQHGDSKLSLEQGRLVLALMDLGEECDRIALNHRTITATAPTSPLLKAIQRFWGRR